MKTATAPPGRSAHQMCIEISTAIGDPQGKKTSKIAIGGT